MDLPEEYAVTLDTALAIADRLEILLDRLDEEFMEEPPFDLIYDEIVRRW